MPETPEQTARRLYPLAVNHLKAAFGYLSPEYTSFLHQYSSAPTPEARASVCARWLSECQEQEDWLARWGRA